MRLTVKLISILFLFSCSKKPELTAAIFGHAGMGLSMENSIYHDNSKEAIELCLAMPKSDGVEVDVQMDKQGCIWLYHDEFLDNITSINGCVNEKTTSELEEAHYKTLKKEKLVKLKDIISLVGPNQKLFLDIKNRNSCSNTPISFDLFNSSLENVISGDNSNIILILSDINWLKTLNESYNSCFSTDNYSEGYNLLNQDPKIQGLIIRNKEIESNQIKQLKTIGKVVYLYDIRSPKGNREALRKNPEGIITDDIRSALIEKY
jgi:glycerophosphoryl diester phosphodiesterase